MAVPRWGAERFARLAARLGFPVRRSPAVHLPAQAPLGSGTSPPSDGAAPPALLLQAMESAANAMLVADRQGRILWVNAAFTRLSGFAPAEVIGQTPRVLRSGRQSPAFYRDLWRTILSGQTWRGRLVNRTKAGGWYDVAQTITPIRGADGRITHFLGVHEDIREQLRVERRLSKDAMFDPDTDLPNQNLLRRRLVDAVARAKRGGQFMAVLAVKLDDPGSAGSAALAQLARRLHSVIRQTDLLAKASEDGFAVVVEQLGAPALAAHPAHRILEALDEPLLVAGQTVRLDGRVGVALHPGDGESPEILLQKAGASAEPPARKAPRVRFADPSLGVAAQRIRTRSG